MNSTASNASSNFPGVLMAGVLIALVVMAVFSQRGWLDWRRMVRQNKHLNTRIVLAKGEREALDHAIQQIRSNRMAQERLVRKVLGYIRAGESVIELN